MNTKGSKSKGGDPDFIQFWNIFQPTPFKWANRFIDQSRWLIGFTLLIFLLLILMTFVPSLGSHQYKILRDYPSLNIILLGWMAVIALTIRWRHHIPAIFQWLWEAERLGQKTDGLKNEYRRFLEDYQTALLSRKGSLSSSISVVILLILMVIVTGMPLFVYLFFTPAGNFIFYAILLMILFLGYLIGSVSRLLIVTSIYIGKLTQRFSIQIQPSHPDGCGGLKPLGDFCITAAIPLIAGGFVMLAIPVLHLDIDLALSFSATLALFLVVGPLTAISVFVPLWNIHNSMVEHKKTYSDQFTGQVMVLEEEMLINTKMRGNLVKAKTAKEKLEILDTLHPDKLSYPVWPFKFTSTVLALFSPQILETLVGIITTIYATFFQSSPSP